MWTLALLLYYFVPLVQSTSEYIKCCPHGYAFGKNLQCVMSLAGDDDAIFKELDLVNNTGLTPTCYRSGEGVVGSHDDESKRDQNLTKLEKCTEIDHRNGTIYTELCPSDWRERLGKCDSLFKPLFFWGASIVVFANLIYVFPYGVVVIFFIAVADLRRRAYDKAVLCYNATQLAIALILLVIGCFILCHRPIKPVWLYIVFGLSLQFLTITSVFWLNIICIDMTLVITRFRWIPGSDLTGSEDIRKFRMYTAYAWGVGAIITVITGFIELCPWIPTSSLVKPNFERFDDGANYGVIFHVTAVPVMTLVLNNILFTYTTWKVIKIRKSTAVANENNRNVRKQYFMFLRLYFLMDAPWIVGVMAAVYPDLWILKFCRMLQPILMLLAILPKKKICRALKCAPVPTTNNANTRIQKSAAETRC